MKNVPINLQDYIEEKLLRYQPQTTYLTEDTQVVYYVQQHLHLLFSKSIGSFYIQKN